MPHSIQTPMCNEPRMRCAGPKTRIAHIGIEARTYGAGWSSCTGRLCVCENSDGRLVAWGLCECMLIRFSTVWLLPFTLLIHTST